MVYKVVSNFLPLKLHKRNLDKQLMLFFTKRFAVSREDFFVWFPVLEYGHCNIPTSIPVSPVIKGDRARKKLGASQEATKKGHTFHTHVNILSSQN